MLLTGAAHHPNPRNPNQGLVQMVGPDFRQSVPIDDPGTAGAPQALGDGAGDHHFLNGRFRPSQLRQQQRTTEQCANRGAEPSLCPFPCPFLRPFPCSFPFPAGEAPGGLHSAPGWERDRKTFGWAGPGLKKETDRCASTPQSESSRHFVRKQGRCRRRWAPSMRVPSVLMGLAGWILRVCVCGLGWRWGLAGRWGLFRVAPCKASRSAL